MKNLILFTLLFFSLTLKAQLYTPMPFVEGMTWRTLTSTGSGEYYDEDKITGDTIIAGKLYKKIYRCSYPNPSTVLGFPLNPFAILYVREDTLNKKVYIGPSEKLLFDFSLQVGDTIHSVHLTDIQNGGVDTVRVGFMDSILIDGTYHKRFQSTLIHPPLSSAYFYDCIEGLGSSRGFVTMCKSFECESVLRCVGKAHNQSIYPDSAYNCVYATSIQDINLKDRIQLYPNPSFNIVHIHGLQDVCEVRIADLFGNEILHNEGYYDNEAIDIHTWPSGMYTVQVVTKKGVVVNRKLVKN